MSVQQLIEIMETLREECPWDQKQTPKTLTRYAIEEAYEVEDAVLNGDAEQVKNELGDLLLQVVFQSQMYKEQQKFDFYDVVDALKQKMIRRHPHVFEKERFNTLDEAQVSDLWQQIKRQEKKEAGILPSQLADIKHGPAIVQAEQIQKKAASIGFDFPHIQDAIDKVYEELDEFKEALAENHQQNIEEEFGDCLFSIINVGRQKGISSDQALLKTIVKFRQRFAYIEESAKRDGKEIDQLTLMEMDQLWNAAKKMKNNENQ